MKRKDFLKQRKEEMHERSEGNPPKKIQNGRQRHLEMYMEEEGFCFERMFGYVWENETRDKITREIM